MTTRPTQVPLMFADRIELVATVAAIAWIGLALATALAHRLPVPRQALMRTDVVVASGVTALLFGAGAALADHVDDAGLGATAYDTAVWAFVLDHRDAAATAVASALRVGGGTVALCALAGAAGLLLLLRGRRLDAALVVSTPLVSTLLSEGLKPGYGRLRPPAEAQLIPETGFSFPSGHTVDATVVLGVLALVLVVDTVGRRRRVAIARRPRWRSRRPERAASTWACIGRPTSWPAGCSVRPGSRCARWCCWWPTAAPGARPSSRSRTTPHRPPSRPVRGSPTRALGARRCPRPDRQAGRGPGSVGRGTNGPYPAAVAGRTVEA